MIQDKSMAYSLLKLYMKGWFKLSFEEIEYYGRENIPLDGAVIFAPNHTNALIDALAVLTIKKGDVVFVSKADIFKNKVIAKVLTFIKIMPIMRLRDGRENMKRNTETIRKSVEVLKSNVPFCIMAEGTHRPIHSLLPLVKGIFRIAIQAYDALKGEMPVYIVPVGIEYGDFFRFRSSLLVNVGKPINVSKIIAENSHLDNAELMLLMKDILSEKIKAQIHCVPDNEDYDALLDTSYICNESTKQKMGINSNSLLAKTLANKYATNILSNKETNNNIIKNARSFAKLRRENSIADEDLYLQPTWLNVLINILTIVLTLPYFVYSVIVSSPIILAAEYANSKTDDQAYFNSFRYAFVFLLMPIILIVLILVLSAYMEWYYVLSLTLLTIPSYSFAHYFAKLLRLTKSHIKMIRNKQLNILRRNIEKDFSLQKN